MHSKVLVGAMKSFINAKSTHTQRRQQKIILLVVIKFTEVDEVDVVDYVIFFEIEHFTMNIIVSSTFKDRVYTFRLKINCSQTN